MKIGHLEIEHSVILAPMSGITDYPFRRMAMEKGCRLAFTEMVSADGLLRKGKSFLRIGKDEHFIGVQLFGSDPEVLAEAAGIVEAMGANVIDLNMGCPAKQVVETGAGASLMRSPEKVKEILLRMRSNVKVPLTIKIRSGWDAHEVNAAEVAERAQDCGVDAIFIHPRTKVQGFRGRADWRLIKKLKEAVHIPVIGNGDVTGPSFAKKMLRETGCDGVMIGRGALGNPWIFSPRYDEAFKEEIDVLPSLKERRKTVEQHFYLLQDHYGEEKAIKEIRRHVAWYTKGLPLSASFRSGLSLIKEKGKLFETIASYFRLVEGRKECQSFGPMGERSITG